MLIEQVMFRNPLEEFMWTQCYPNPLYWLGLAVLFFVVIFINFKIEAKKNRWK